METRRKKRFVFAEKVELYTTRWDYGEICLTKGRLKHHNQIDGFGIGECFVFRQNIGIV